MEDLITIIIVVIGVAIKIIGSLKKRDPEPESSSETMTWDEFIEAADKDPELQEMINSDPDLQAGLEQAKQQKAAHEAALRQAQIERDAALLAQQRAIEEMAEKAQAANQSSMAGECSEIYTNIPDDGGNEDDSAGNWAELIRSNRTEAVVISEILAPPAALR